MLKVENIHFAYDKEILNEISFELKQGEVLGIVGKSGGGKSSLLKIIGGHLTALKGQIIFQGLKLKPANEQLIPGYDNIALVHQDFSLNLYYTVKENIQEKVLHLPKKFQDQLIKQMMDLLELHQLSEQQAVSLSGGEQQRLSIARALTSEADLILLDEPFVHLDTPMRRKLIIYLRQLKEIRNTSFVIVTHNGEEILGLCDEVIYLKKGRIKRKGNPENFYTKPKNIEEAEFFGHINSVYFNEKRYIFRPDQYSANSKDGARLELNFKRMSKQGPLIHNYFKTEKGEEIILFNFESMESVNCIYV